VVTILVEEPMWRADSNVIPTIRRAARLAMNMLSGKRDGMPVSILLANDARLRDLNAAFRNQRKTTNVLSFPALPTAPDYLGDVALGYQILFREAAAQHKSLAEHAAHLTIHGFLHIAGYEHQRAADSLIMENLEISFFNGTAIGDIYTAVPIRRRAKRHKLALCPRMPAR
jgi:probable rRNA maturation factor